jgi:hypothetical protein
MRERRGLGHALALVAVSVLSLPLAHAAAIDDATGPRREIPRTILALYDGHEDREWIYSTIHTRAELPLNYLGLVVRYHDVYEGLPSDAELDGVRGVLTWFHSSPIADVSEYARWAERLVESDRKLVVMGYLGVDVNDRRFATSNDVGKLFRTLGLASDNEWVSITYDVEIVEKNDEMLEFERPLDTLLPAYPLIRVHREAPDVVRHLEVRRSGAPSTQSVLVATSSRGGFIAPSYALYDNTKGTVQWYVDPFEFYRLAFDTDDLPKPDTTTVAGRRVFYSHIDGDGWRNLSEISEYHRRGSTSAEVVLEEIIKEFTDLPVTVAPVVGDLDPEWFGTADALRVARRIFAQPHVEAGTHTYSHPLDWGSYAPEAVHKPGETPPRASEYSFTESLRRLAARFGLLSNEEALDRGWEAEAYDRPRSYELKPFDLDFEIEGSARFIEQLLPPGKGVEIVQWSGNTTPFEKAIAAARAIGLANINGGDSRLDTEFPSYAWVAPVGRMVGNELQVYASNSNENTYTDLWTDRFFGFKHLTTTLENTESPRRVKPFNVYYHMYSGEKLPSLIAVRENLAEARRNRLAPITTSRYARIVEGFFSTRVWELGEDRFQFDGRGALNTVAFDGRHAFGVDWSRSKGVVGQRHHQGRLYVMLDASVAVPVVALSTTNGNDRTPFLMESRWDIYGLRRAARGFSFRAQGFGQGEMTWFVGRPGRFLVRATRNGQSVLETDVESSPEGFLQLVVAASAIAELTIHVDETSLSPGSRRGS